MPTNKSNIAITDVINGQSMSYDIAIKKIGDDY